MNCTIFFLVKILFILFLIVVGIFIPLFLIVSHFHLLLGLIRLFLKFLNCLIIFYARFNQNLIKKDNYQKTYYLIISISGLFLNLKKKEELSKFVYFCTEIYLIKDMCFFCTGIYLIKENSIITSLIRDLKIILIYSLLILFIDFQALIFEI